MCRLAILPWGVSHPVRQPTQFSYEFMSVACSCEQKKLLLVHGASATAAVRHRHPISSGKKNKRKKHRPLRNHLALAVQAVELCVACSCGHYRADRGPDASPGVIIPEEMRTDQSVPMTLPLKIRGVTDSDMQLLLEKACPSQPRIYPEHWSR